MNFSNKREDFRKFVLENLKEKFFLISLFFLFSIFLGAVETSVVGSLRPIIDVLQDPSKINTYNKLINSYLEINLETELFTKIFFLFFALLFLLSGSLSITTIYLSNKVREYFHFSWKKKLLNGYFKKEISFFSKFQPGDLIQKILLHTREGASFFYEISTIIRESFVALAIYILLLIISIKYTIYLSLFALVIFFITWTVGRLFVVEQTKKRNEAQKEIFSLVEIIIRGIKIIKSFNKEKYFEDLFTDKNFIYKKKEILTTSFTPLPAILLRNLVFIIILVATYTIINQSNNLIDHANLSTFVIFIGGFYKINNCFGAINNAILSSSRLLPSLQIISEELKENEKTKIELDNEKIKSFDLNNFNNQLEFKNMNFTHEGNNEPTIDNINFKINKGSSNLFIGPSGSGKSTFIDLIIGFKKCDGFIKIDKNETLELKKTKLNNFSYLGQNSFLFPGTIKENIIFFEKEIDEKRYDEVVNLCKIKEILEKFSKITNLTEDESIKLSEGQKQRICLARTLYSDKSIVILDEALSNIEKSLEKVIINDVLNYIKNKNQILIVVSHSLKNYEKADKILVLNFGKIIQEGTHSELKDLEGFYKKNVRTSE